VVIDTGASWSVTPRVKDFVSPIEPAIDSLRSLSGSIKVHGVGTVEWLIEDQLGITKTIRTRALFVPTGEDRLFSPQTFFKENNGGSLHCCTDGVMLTLPDDTTMSFPWQPISNLPYMLRYEYLKRNNSTNSSTI
jgi:hypothetical protein